MQFLQLILISKTINENYIESVNFNRKTLKMKKLTFALIATTVFSMGAVNAQTADSKFYGGAEIGSSKLDNETGTTTSALVRAYGGSASATQDAAVRNFRIFGGYTVNENLDFELGYIQTSNFGISATGRSSGGVNYAISASAKYSGLDYSAVIRPSVASGYNNLFARIGFTNYTGDVTGSASAGGSTFTSTSSASGTGELFGIGYDAKLDNGMSIRTSINRLTKIAGESDNSATVISIGLMNRF
jgi:hypothetical protein